VELQQRRVLEHVGVRSMARTWHNLSPAELYEHAIRRGEAHVVATGALDAETGQHTGRSPKDKFFVKEPSSESRIWWGGNRPIAPELPAQGPGSHRAGLAQPFRPQPLHPPHAG